jgi:predicted PurR-regulated permease PerM
MLRPKDETPQVVKLASFLIVIALGLTFLSLAKSILVPIAFAGLFSLLLYPLCQFFENNGFPRIIAILLTMLIVVCLVVGVIVLLSTQIYNFINQLPGIADRINAIMDDTEWFLFKNFNIQIDTKGNLLQNSLSKFMDSGVVFLTGTISSFLDLLNIFGLIPVYIFLFLLYRNAFHDFFLFVTPIEKHRTVKRILFQVQKVVQNYIIGLFTVMFIIGLLNSLALYIIGIDYPLFFGFLGAFLTIIPYVGIFIGSLLPTLYALLTKDSGWYAVAVIGAFAFVQFLEGNFITPRITGNKVKVNALAAILALVVGGWLWGMAGLVVFMPLIAIVKVLFDNIPSLRPYGVLLGTEIYEGINVRGLTNKETFRIAGYKKKR